MPDDQPRVPEAVLEAFCLLADDEVESSVPTGALRERLERGLAAALAQHHKELLGDAGEIDPDRAEGEGRR